MSILKLPLCSHRWEMASQDCCVCAKCGEVPTLWVRKADGMPDVLYKAQPHQEPYHLSSCPNLIMLGPRSTGKTTAERFDLHMRAMQVPGLKYLMLRRTMPELKTSHLIYLPTEMDRLGGFFHKTDSIANYPNGSLGFYRYLDSEADAMKFLSAEYDVVCLDEIVTFREEMIVKVASCARVPTDSGRIALVRGGMNKLGVGAEYVKRYYVDKDVSFEENPDYHPDDYDVILHKFTDNVYTDIEQYKKRLQALPEHVRKAWLDDEWVVEGAYFSDWRPKKNDKPWHVIDEMPLFRGQSIIGQPWVSIYRAVDWGYAPDPAVCLWIAVLPNKRSIVFKERTWKETLAEDVARQIKRESEGMRIVETFADPTMLIDDGKGQYGVGDIFEQNGVPLTPSVNKRDAYGYAIHAHLNTIVDELPQMQVLAGDGKFMGCPQLIKTLPTMRTGPKDPNKIADGNDHWTVALAYYCMGLVPAAKDPKKSETPRWMTPKRPHRYARLAHA